MKKIVNRGGVAGALGGKVVKRGSYPKHDAGGAGEFRSVL